MYTGSIWATLTKPGIAQIYLLILISVLFYLELRMMPLKCFVEIRARQQRLTYSPKFLLAPEQDFCKNYSYLLVYQTKMSDRGKREFFRETLGSYAEQYNFTTIFPVGISLNATLNERVLGEHRIYGDILQADFLDTYRNLTLKTYSYTHYISKNCSSVRAVLKVDDDIVFNVPRMFNYLSEVDLSSNTLHCRTLDDVFSTGIVAREAGVTFRNLTVNTDTSDYGSFLNGTAMAQYVEKTSDIIPLLKLIDNNSTSPIPSLG
ncbi:N-acetyllactosaminide 3-alpha-galactosyltransferase [Oesophagostomum dentatum]|uniref:Hexosyltransferase n=1 Tax=Oesophagostomum dentatum TaxID=61180 RepID=A0A0B1T384_OESDE|nr:N-acetyllactosaminide 3-alpha-galactosyltransferase [Oesophagostomum dentatum]